MNDFIHNKKDTKTDKLKKSEKNCIFFEKSKKNGQKWGKTGKKIHKLLKLLHFFFTFT